MFSKKGKTSVARIAIKKGHICKRFITLGLKAVIPNQGAKAHKGTVSQGNAKDRIFRIFVFRERRNRPVFLIEFVPENKQCFRTRENFAKQVRK